MISESLKYIPLEIKLKIQIKSYYSQIAVVNAVYKILSHTTDDYGNKGFFHLDNLSPGQNIFLSDIITRVTSINGIKSVEVIQFKKLGVRTNSFIDLGNIPMAKNEIPRIDTDPNNLENGILKIIAFGGD